MRAPVLQIATLAVALTAASIEPTRAQTAPPAPPPFPATDGAAVMIVFDGSGSMWARLEGERQAKFVTVRDALRPLLGRVDAKVAIGLTAFGARRRADCGDVAVVVPAASGADRLTAVLDRFNPQGKSPLTAAIREAAKALPKGAGPRSLIVLHDDLDNCNADPCSALADIQASGVVVHAIGIGLRPEDAPKLQCLTEPTKGRSIDAQTPAAVATALDEIVQVALTGRSGLIVERPAVALPVSRSAPTASVVPSPVQPGARVPLRADGPSGVRLATVLAAGESPRTPSAAWVVRRAGSPLDTPPVFSGRGQDVLLPAEPGDYVADVRDGFVRVVGVPFTVPERGQVALDIPLVAGLVRVPQPIDAASRDAIVTVIRSTDLHRSGDFLGVVAAIDVHGGLVVPPGSYVVRLADGGARIDRMVDVVAGGVMDLGATWPFGRLQIAFGRPGDTARADATIIVYEDDPDAPLGRREVTRSAAAQPDLALPTGTYTVVARSGSVDVRDRIVVQGGAIVRHTMTIGGARLSLASRLVGPTVAPSDDPVSYRVERLDGPAPQVFTAHRAMADMTIPAGRYRVEARHGLANARVAREVVLADGDTVALTLDQAAGVATFVPPIRGAVVAWEVLGADGTVVWTSAQLRPRVVLLAGRYTVRLETRDKRVERTLDVRAGDSVSVDMPDGP